MSDSRTSANDELAAIVASRQHARIPTDQDHPEGERTMPCLLMCMGERWCALHAESVREVIAVEAITPVPSQMPHILGVVLVHGRLVPVVDFCRLAQKPDMALLTSPARRLVVVANDELEIGLVTDDAKGVIELPALSPAAQISDRADFILGELNWNDERLVAFLDEDRLLRAALGITEPQLEDSLDPSRHTELETERA